MKRLNPSERLKPKITVDRLRELIDYDPLTGYFTWRIKKNSKSRASIGGHAGTLNERGYLRLALDGKHYQGHRIAWLYVSGVWPMHTIDHINGVRSDNRIVNLRDATIAINSQNQRPKRNNASGLLGAFLADRTGRNWQSSIKVNGKNIYLGRFVSTTEAHEAYVAAKRRLHEGNML